MRQKQGLTELADRKAALRRTISLRRSRCMVLADRVTRPVEQLECLLALIRALCSLAAPRKK
jgi:hypothetical protein